MDPEIQTRLLDFERVSMDVNVNEKGEPHGREFLSHVDRKKLRLPFARILEAIRFAFMLRKR